MHMQRPQRCSQCTGLGMPSLCPTLALLQLASTTQKGAYTSIWRPRFCSCHPGVTSRLPGLEPSKFYDFSPTEPHIFAYWHSSFIALCFIALCRYCIFYRLKICGNPVSSKSSGTIFPKAFSHFVSLCHIVVILANGSLKAFALNNITTKLQNI